MNKKKERKRDVLIDLLGLGILGNDFGRSRTVNSTLGWILVVLGIGFLVLAIATTDLFFNLLLAITLISSGLYKINQKRRKIKNGR